MSFPECVRWTTIEFDAQCGTAQPEDVLRLLIPSRTLHLSSMVGKPLIHDTINTWTELKKFSGATGWPTTVLVLPGKKRLKQARANYGPGATCVPFSFFIQPAKVIIN